MTPTDRYVLLDRGGPVLTSNDPQALVVYLWGRDLYDWPGGPSRYVVLDYERPVVVDTADLRAVVARLQMTPQRTGAS